MSVKGRIYIGTSGWSYPQWQGLYYPVGLAKARWFEYYCQHFNTVELNATFYRAFQDTTYDKWYHQAPDDFKYVVKAHRFITHRKLLHDVKDSIKRCWTSAHRLKEKLGLVLMQLSPNTPYDLSRLEQALTAFKNPQQIAVEFRDPSWYTPSTLQLLKKYHAVFCNSDSPDIALTDHITAKTAYFRLHGRGEWYTSNYSKSQLKQIATMITKIQKQGVQDVYVFFNNDCNAYAAKNALALRELLGV